MLDAVRNYLSLAGGITEVTRQRAVAAAKGLVSSGEATAEQVGVLADTLVETSRSNREAVASLVRYETDRALGRLGLASSEEVQTLTRRLQMLEAKVRALQEAAERAPAAEPEAAPAGTAAPAAATRRATGSARTAAARTSGSVAKAATGAKVSGTKPAATKSAAPAKGSGTRPAAAAKASGGRTARSATPRSGGRSA